MDEASPRTKGSRRCTNPDCEYGGWWVIGKIVVNKNGRLMCLGKGCHSIYDAREVIDPENDDSRLWVGLVGCRRSELGLLVFAVVG